MKDLIADHSRVEAAAGIATVNMHHVTFKTNIVKA
jgi:hypothetical protein